MKAKVEASDYAKNGLICRRMIGRLYDDGRDVTFSSPQKRISFNKRCLFRSRIPLQKHNRPSRHLSPSPGSPASAKHRWTMPNTSSDGDLHRTESVLFRILSCCWRRHRNGARVPRFLGSNNIDVDCREAVAATGDPVDRAIHRRQDSTSCSETVKIPFCFRNRQRTNDSSCCAVHRSRQTLGTGLSSINHNRFPDRTRGYRVHDRRTD